MFASVLVGPALSAVIAEQKRARQKRESNRDLTRYRLEFPLEQAETERAWRRLGGRPPSPKRLRISNQGTTGEAWDLTGSLQSEWGSRQARKTNSCSVQKLRAPPN